jgi:hypothetical protein
MPLTQEKPLEAPVLPERTPERALERTPERILETADKHLAADAANEAANETKVCWLEVKRYPYQPYHQVELLHLQAEADALLIKLKANGQKQANEQPG